MKSKKRDSSPEVVGIRMTAEMKKALCAHSNKGLNIYLVSA